MVPLRPETRSRARKRPQTLYFIVIFFFSNIRSIPVNYSKVGPNSPPFGQTQRGGGVFSVQGALPPPSPSAGPCSWPVAPQYATYAHPLSRLQRAPAPGLGPERARPCRADRTCPGHISPPGRAPISFFRFSGRGFPQPTGSGSSSSRRAFLAANSCGVAHSMPSATSRL